MVQRYSGGHAERDLRRGFMTKHMIKGAAGGIRGADYQDLEAEFLERRDGAAAINARKTGRQQSLAAQLMQAAAQGQAITTVDAAKSAGPVTIAAAVDGVDARNVVNATAAQAEKERIDPKVKIEDDRVKRKLLLRDPDSAEEEWEEEDEEEIDIDVEWTGPFADGEVDTILRDCSNEQIGRIATDSEAEMRIYGTLRLLDPADMREVLGTPLRIARHLRVVAERMLASDRFSRLDVIHYLTGCIVNMGPVFGGSALRCFCASVGISAIYPLEVVHHLAELVPQFIPRTTLAPFLLGRKKRVARAGKPMTISCDPGLKITGLALKGGGEPGYQFAPRSEAGKFALCVLTEGYYRFLLSAVDPYGFERVQELWLKVKDPADTSDDRGPWPMDIEEQERRRALDEAGAAEVVGDGSPARKKRKKPKKKKRPKTEQTT